MNDWETGARIAFEPQLVIRHLAPVRCLVLPSLLPMKTSQEGRHALAETVAEYGTPADTPYEKLSVSLPAELLQEVRQAARESGTSVSGVIAAALRQSLDRVEQDRLDQALAQDASDNEAWARDALALTARAWADLKW